MKGPTFYDIDDIRFAKFADGVIDLTQHVVRPANPGLTLGSDDPRANRWGNGDDFITGGPHTTKM